MNLSVYIPSNVVPLFQEQLSKQGRKACGGLLLSQNLEEEEEEDSQVCGYLTTKQNPISKKKSKQKVKQNNLNELINQQPGLYMVAKSRLGVPSQALGRKKKKIATRSSLSCLSLYS